MSDAHVRFGDFISVGGTLVPGAFKVHLGVRNLPETVTVEWKRGEESFVREVDLSDIRTPGPDDIIFFEVLPGDKVAVSVRSDLPQTGT